MKPQEQEKKTPGTARLKTSFSKLSISKKKDSISTAKQLQQEQKQYKKYSTDLTWKQAGGLLFARNPQEDQTNPKIAGFDFDSTISVTESGLRFSKNPNDWKYLNQFVKPTLQRLVFEQKYRLVIFTNQGGIGSKKLPVDQFKAKFVKFSNNLGVPFVLMAATTDDEYRKPGIGMWNYLQDKLSKGKAKKLDIQNSFYCGDAAGRPKTATTKADFSDSDLKFALNLGMQFRLPQDVFKKKDDNDKQEVKEKPKKIAPKGFNPGKLPTEGCVFKGEKETDKIHSDEQQLIIFVGSPGAGKSTFWQTHLKDKDYVRVNQDTLKTKQKCLKVMTQVLKDERSAVIDNTNRDKQVRSMYYKVAKGLNIPVRCFYFDAPKDLALHNDKMRKLNPHRKHLSKKAGSITIHTFYKQVEIPSVDEGFTEVKMINFIAGPFENDEDKKLYFSFV